MYTRERERVHLEEQQSRRRVEASTGQEADQRIQTLKKDTQYLQSLVAKYRDDVQALTANHAMTLSTVKIRYEDQLADALKSQDQINA